MIVRDGDPRGEGRSGPTAVRSGRRGRRVDASVVVKVGGSVVDGPGLDGVVEGVARLHRRGIRCTLVHGGGPFVTRALERLGVSTRFVDGLRVTGPASIEVIEMVLSGQVNPLIVGRLRAAGIRAVGVSGSDGGILTAAPHPDSGRLGRVGRIVDVDPSAVEALHASRFLPVVSPVSADAAGTSFNVNADRAAAALAVGLSADRLVIVSDVDGVLDGGGRRLERVSTDAARGLVDEGIALGGMVPKLRACLRALEAGLPEARLIGGGSAGRLVSAALGRGIGGTSITAAPAAVAAAPGT